MIRFLPRFLWAFLAHRSPRRCGHGGIPPDQSFGEHEAGSLREL